jgi:hypothetical protein
MKKILNVRTMIRLLPLLLIIVVFILYRAYKWQPTSTSSVKENFENANKKYTYIPNLSSKLADNGQLVYVSNEIDDSLTEFSYVSLVQDTMKFIDFLKFDYFKLVTREDAGFPETNPENPEEKESAGGVQNESTLAMDMSKYSMEVTKTKMYEKRKEVEQLEKEGNKIMENLEKKYGDVFNTELDEDKIRKFDKEIKASNYLVNAIGLHLYNEGKQVEPTLHKFKNYFIEQVGMFMGNKSKLDVLKEELYSWLISGVKIKMLVDEYKKIMPFTNDKYELAYLLDSVKEELYKTATTMECKSEWVADETIFYVFNYLQILFPVYSLVTSQELFNSKQLTLNIMSMHEFANMKNMEENIIPKLYFQK